MKSQVLEYGSLHEVAKGVPEDDWLQLVATSTERKLMLGAVPMPTAPDLAKQAIFNGTGGESAVKNAIPVYKYALKTLRRFDIDNISNFLDFGCGWGRFTRMFVRDVPDGGLYGVDPWPQALQMCREHMAYASFLKSEFLPPLPFRDGMFDAVFANSVFSHLPEHLALAWILEIKRILRPGGVLIATTHPRSLFATITEFQNTDRAVTSPWHEALRDGFGDIEAIVAKYDRGEFIFAATTKNDVLNPDNYGDSFVPEAYIRRVWGKFMEVVDFVNDPMILPQATFVLRRSGG